MAAGVRLVAALAVALVAIVLCLTVVPSLLVPDDALDPRVKLAPADQLERASALVERRNEVRTAAVQALGGLVLVAGALYTARTYGLSRQGHLTDRITAAVNQLQQGGAAAIGGIFALQRVARDSDRDRQMVVDLLARYVRMQQPVGGTTAMGTPAPVRIDGVTQTALDVIGDLHSGQDEKVLDLSGSRLDGADLRNAKLSAAYLRGSTLAGARLSGAHATTADLKEADLSEVDALGLSLRGATLSGARLTRANVSGDVRDAKLDHVLIDETYFGECDLRGTSLFGAQGDASTNFFRARMNDCVLRRARLDGALFDEACLERVSARDAHLRGALFRHADLRALDAEGADLRDADFRGADCRGARFPNAQLAGARFEGARIDDADFGAAQPPAVS